MSINSISSFFHSAAESISRRLPFSSPPSNTRTLNPTHMHTNDRAPHTQQSAQRITSVDLKSTSRASSSSSSFLFPSSTSSSGSCPSTAKKLTQMKLSSFANTHQKMDLTRMFAVNAHSEDKDKDKTLKSNASRAKVRKAVAQCSSGGRNEKSPKKLKVNATDDKKMDKSDGHKMNIDETEASAVGKVQTAKKPAQISGHNTITGADKAVPDADVEDCMTAVSEDGKAKDKEKGSKTDLTMSISSPLRIRLFKVLNGGERVSWSVTNPHSQTVQRMKATVKSLCKAKSQSDSKMHKRNQSASTSLSAATAATCKAAEAMEEEEVPALVRVRINGQIYDALIQKSDEEKQGNLTHKCEGNAVNHEGRDGEEDEEEDEDYEDDEDDDDDDDDEDDEDDDDDDDKEGEAEADGDEQADVDEVTGSAEAGENEVDEQDCAEIRVEEESPATARSKAAAVEQLQNFEDEIENDHEKDLETLKSLSASDVVDDSRTLASALSSPRATKKRRHECISPIRLHILKKVKTSANGSSTTDYEVSNVSDEASLLDVLPPSDCRKCFNVANVSRKLMRQLSAPPCNFISTDAVSPSKELPTFSPKFDRKKLKRNNDKLSDAEKIVEDERAHLFDVQSLQNDQTPATPPRQSSLATSSSSSSSSLHANSSSLQSRRESWQSWHEWQHQRFQMVDSCWRGWTNNDRVSLLKFDRALESHLAHSHFNVLFSTIDQLFSSLPLPFAENGQLHSSLHSYEKAECTGRLKFRSLMELLINSDNSGQLRRMIMCEPMLLFHMTDALSRIKKWIQQSQKREMEQRVRPPSAEPNSASARRSPLSPSSSPSPTSPISPSSSSSSFFSSSSSRDRGASFDFSDGLPLTSESAPQCESGGGCVGCLHSSFSPVCGCLAACLKDTTDLYLLMFACIYMILIFLLDDDQFPGKTIKHGGLSAMVAHGLCHSALNSKSAVPPRPPRKHRVAALTKNPRASLMQLTSNGDETAQRAVAKASVNPYAAKTRPAPRAILFRFDHICLHLGFLWPLIIQNELQVHQHHT